MFFYFELLGFVQKIKRRRGGSVVCCLIYFFFFLFDFIDLLFRVERPLLAMLLIRVLQKLGKFWLDMEQRLIFKMKYFWFFLFFWGVYFWIEMVKKIKEDVSHFLFSFCFNFVWFVVRLDIPLFIKLLRKVMKKWWKFWLNMEQELIFKGRYFLIFIFLLLIFLDVKLIDWLICGDVRESGVSFFLFLFLKSFFFVF